ncbi:restriction endonuclease subunit S [Acinetobacter seifertii]|nr:restriction endonuclease subunit S [Acinetobacter seifertii]
MTIGFYNMNFRTSLITLINSGGDMVYNEIFNREIPSDWRIGTLNELGEIVGGSTPSTDDPDNFSEDGFPWISPVDLSKNSGKKYL